MKKTLAAGLAFALLVGCASHAPLQSALDRIDTIVVIYAENHSFDNMYGMFPGANGVANAPPESRVQRDHDGKPLASLPPVYTSGKPDASYPTKGLPGGMGPNPTSTDIFLASKLNVNNPGGLLWRLDQNP